MSGVADFVQVKARPNDDVVSELREILEDAENGKIRGYVMCASGPRTITTAACGEYQLYEMLGHLFTAAVIEAVKHDELLREKIIEAMDAIE